MKTKVVITNCYAVNNGDMALVLALYQELNRRGYEVSIATFYYTFLSERYPDLPLIRELLDRSFLKGGTAVKKLFFKLYFRINKKYRNHDVFISAPGGYMNAYYGLKRSLLPLVEAKKDNKKTAVYSQSIGPLDEKNKSLLAKFSKSIDVMLVRDDYSLECVRSIDCSSKILQTKDAAFLLPPRRSKAKSETRRVAVSVREWSFDNRSMDQFYSLIKTLCMRILQAGYQIEFISTCQGVEGYRDDSKIAALIKTQLTIDHPEYAESIVVDTNFHTYYELAELLNSRYIFTIGTRLHMCILSLINGTPAFNISYEVKGIECYKYLGLSEFSVDYNEAVEMAEKKFTNFFNSYSDLKARLPELLVPVHEESKASLDQFLRMMKM